MSGLPVAARKKGKGGGTVTEINAIEVRAEDMVSYSSEDTMI